MLKISIGNIDKLESLCSELLILTYLQCLAEYDSESEIIYENSLKSIKSQTNNYLIKQQLNTLTELDALINSNDFIEKV